MPAESSVPETCPQTPIPEPSAPRPPDRATPTAAGVEAPIAGRCEQRIRTRCGPTLWTRSRTKVSGCAHPESRSNQPNRGLPWRAKEPLKSPFVTARAAVNVNQHVLNPRAHLARVSRVPDTSGGESIRAAYPVSRMLIGEQTRPHGAVLADRRDFCDGAVAHDFRQRVAPPPGKKTC